LEQVRHRAQRSRLAGPVGAQQRHDAAFGHLQRHSFQHQDDVVVDDLDAVHVEQHLVGLDSGGSGHGGSGTDGRRRGAPAAGSHQPSHLRGVMFFSLAYLAAASFTSGRVTDLSDWYQSDTTLNSLPSHWAMRAQSSPMWLSHEVLTGRMMSPKPSSFRRSCVMFRFSKPQRTCSGVMCLPLPYFSCAVRMASTCSIEIIMPRVCAMVPTVVLPEASLPWPLSYTYFFRSS